MALTTGIAAVCQAWNGGGEKLYLADKADVTSFTLVGGIYTAVTMASGKVFKEYAFYDDTFDWKEDSNRNTESGTTMIKNTLEMFIQGKSQTLRDAIEEVIGSSTCGVIAILEDNNDTKWVIGYGERNKRALKMSTGAGTIGKKLDDMVGTTITLTNDTVELARTFTGTVPV